MALSPEAIKLREDLRKIGVHVKAGAILPEKVAIEGPVGLSDLVGRGWLSVGAYTFFGTDCETRAVSIGRFCSIARRVVIGLVEHPTSLVSSHPIGYLTGGAVFQNDPYFSAIKKKAVFQPNSDKVSIGSDVWIGDGAVIRGGVTVGHGAVIGARSVVTRDVPPYAIVAGTPARILRYRFEPDLIAALIETQWWSYDVTEFGHLFNDPAQFVSALARSGPLEQLRPPRLEVGGMTLRI